MRNAERVAEVNDKPQVCSIVPAVLYKPISMAPATVGDSPSQAVSPTEISCFSKEKSEELDEEESLSFWELSNAPIDTAPPKNRAWRTPRAAVTTRGDGAPAVVYQKNSSLEQPNEYKKKFARLNRKQPA